MKSQIKLTYPDHTLQNTLREREINCVLMWEMRGPRDTSIAWLSCYQVANSIVIIETFSDGGWNAFTPAKTIEIDKTIADVIDRTS